AEVLVARSADADVLVVGSRGHGGFGELLLGSVSHAVVLHAVCPVVVVPSPREERRIRTPLPPRRAEATEVKLLLVDSNASSSMAASVNKACDRRVQAWSCSHPFPWPPGRT